ncbi:MAG TPA: S9 family peptidase, partial [Acidobacteriota bacterium]|nr:S9 family peptidase [Acidobacteriota bacterium]
MNPRFISLATLSFILLGGCAGPGTPAAPPIAEQRSHEVAAPHGAVRIDEYYWLRDDERKDPAMLAYLEAENAYADAVLAPLASLRKRLFDELVGRIKQDDATVPYREGDYFYYTRFEEGGEYPIHARRKGDMDAEEEILLDVNEMARGHAFFQVANLSVSPDQQQLAYLVDTVGRRQFSLHVKDLETGEVRDTGVAGVSYSLVWANDNRTIFYVWNDPGTLLTKRVKAHRLGTEPAEDRLIYEEPDDSFYIGVDATQSKKYVCIELSSTVSNEQRCADRDDPTEFRI